MSTAFAPVHGSHQGASMQDYRNLKVWQKAHQLTLRTYAFSATLTTPPAWPLRDQMIRAAISIPSNIAEGAGRGTDSDFARFVTYLGFIERARIPPAARPRPPILAARRVRSDVRPVDRGAANAARTALAAEAWRAYELTAPNREAARRRNWELEAGSWKLEAGS